MDYLSLCLIAKDEDEYLQEWIDYHILIGVERFYIYDNESKNPIREILKEYIDLGWVVVHEISGKAVQVMAYQHCLVTYGKNSKWIGFIDADEFIVLTKEMDLKNFLIKYEEYGGLAMSSVFFGTGGHQEHPIGGQIINYQERFPFGFDDNQLIKSIVQPERVESALSPHDFIYKDLFYCINSNKKRVDSQRFPVCYDDIRVNHYFMRSNTAFHKKMERIGGAGRSLDRNRMQYWLTIPMENDVEILKTISKKLALSLGYLKKHERNSNSFTNLLHRKIKNDLSKKPKLNQNSFVNANDYISPHFDVNTEINLAKENQDWKKAKLLLLNSIKQVPAFAVRYTGYASTCLILKEMNEAEKALTISVEKFGKTYEVLRVIGDYWIAKNEYHEAELSFREMLLIGEELDTLTRLAFVLILQKKNDEILVILTKIINDYLYADSLNNVFFKKVIQNCFQIVERSGKPQEVQNLIKKYKQRFSDNAL